MPISSREWCCVTLVVSSRLYPAVVPVAPAQALTPKSEGSPFRVVQTSSDPLEDFCVGDPSADECR